MRRGFLRRLRKRLGIYTKSEIMTTYANAIQHGRKIPADITDGEMIKTGVKMMEDWIKALNRF